MVKGKCGWALGSFVEVAALTSPNGECAGVHVAGYYPVVRMLLFTQWIYPKLISFL